MTHKANATARKKRHNLERFVGKIVRLRQQAYLRISCRRHASRQQENRFLVAAIDPQMQQLICYGGNFRINVDPNEIILV